MEDLWYNGKNNLLLFYTRSSRKYEKANFSFCILSPSTKQKFNVAIVRKTDITILYVPLATKDGASM
jgi:hypothetical protein